MGKRIAAKITGVAGYVPPRVVTNSDLEKIVDTTDEWIRSRTGIRERHYADPGVGASHLGTEAAKKLLAAKGRAAGRNRNDRRRHGNAGHAFPRHGLLDSGPPRRVARLGIRSFRRLLGLHLRADDGRAIRRRGNAQESAGDRQRRDDFHPRFQGPRHLRAFRRRRGRRAAGAGHLRVGRNHRFRQRCGRLRRLQPLYARPEGRCIRPRTKRSTSACTTFTRKASRYSNMRCGA